MSWAEALFVHVLVSAAVHSVFDKAGARQRKSGRTLSNGQVLPRV